MTHPTFFCPDSYLQFHAKVTASINSGEKVSFLMRFNEFPTILRLWQHRGSKVFESTPQPRPHQDHHIEITLLDRRYEYRPFDRFCTDKFSDCQGTF
jgi:hypothetical protein